MSARLKGRRRSAAAVADRVAGWGRDAPDVRAVIQVGSYARGAETMASDLDLVVIVDDPVAVAESAAVSGWFPRARVIARRRWGPVHEVRMRLASGLIVEWGFAPESWLDVPLDAGTARVLRDGHVVLYDAGIAAPAIAALERGFWPRRLGRSH